MRCATTRRPSGFTLIEAAVVISISALLSSLAYASLTGMEARSSSRAGLMGIEALLRQARSEAFGRGADVVFFAHPTDSGEEYGALVDPQGAFDPSNVAASLLPTDVYLGRSPVPAGVTLRATTDPVLAQPLPAPFDQVPASTPCTFCDATGEVVVVFHPDGTASLGQHPELRPLGGSISLVAMDPDAPSSTTPLAEVTLVVLSRTGTVASFDR